MTEKAFEIDALLSKYSSKPAKAAKPELLAVYGQPGCGKSYFAGTVAGLPNFKKGLILDTEGSTVGVVTDQRFDVIRVDKQPDPFKFLSTILSKGKQGLFNPANKHSYDVIILDTLDIAQDLAQS